MDDFISREEAIKAVDDYTLTNCPEYMHDWATNLKRAILEDVKSDIGNIPAADVQPIKFGKWIDDGCIAKCNHCGEQKRFPHWSFCPNCGATMKQEG